jgi:hypothetical protein
MLCIKPRSVWGPRATNVDPSAMRGASTTAATRELMTLKSGAGELASSPGLD